MTTSFLQLGDARASETGAGSFAELLVEACTLVKEELAHRACELSFCAIMNQNYLTHKCCGSSEHRFDPLVSCRRHRHTTVCPAVSVLGSARAGGRELVYVHPFSEATVGTQEPSGG